MEAGGGEGHGIPFYDQLPDSPAFWALNAAIGVVLFATLGGVLLQPQLRASPHGRALLTHVGCITTSYATGTLSLLRDYYARIVFMVASVYSFLAFFHWLNVMALDIFLTFSARPRLRHLARADRKFLWYSLYAFGSPAVLTAAATSLFYAHMSELSGRWAFRRCPSCPNRTLPAFLFIDVPLFTLILANGLLLALAARGLWAALRAAEALDGAESSRHGAVWRPASQNLVYGKLMWMTGVRESAVYVVSWVMLWFSFELHIVQAALNLAMVLAIFWTLCWRRELAHRLGSRLRRLAGALRGALKPGPSTASANTRDSVLEAADLSTASAAAAAGRPEKSSFVTAEGEKLKTEDVAFTTLQKL